MESPIFWLPSSAIVGGTRALLWAWVPFRSASLLRSTWMSRVHQDFSGPITSDKPARSGEIIHLYASGLGPVTPPVPDGATAPASPLSRTLSPVTCGALDA